MADDLLTTADLIAFQLGLGHNELMELKAAAPVVEALPAFEASDGAVHKYTKTVQLPVVGFRAENAGRDFDKSEDEEVTENCKILDWSFAVDKAVADSRGREKVVSREEMMHIKAALFKLELQTINGTVADADGFNGWKNNGFIDQAADEMVIDAGGITDLTSVYLIRVGEMECASIYQGDSIGRGDTIVQNMADATGKHFPTYYTPGCGWFCTQIGSKYSMARVANLDAGSNTLNDDLLYQAAALFPAGVNPTHVVMNRRSQEQLRSSRTATNPTGAPAPNPTMALDGNTPIIVTDAIGNADTQVAAAAGAAKSPKQSAK